MPPKLATGKNNGSITNFFRPVPSPQAHHSSQASQPPSQPASAESALRAPSPLPPSSPVSHLSTPKKPAARSRDAVIAASDDDDDDASEDDELEDLMAKFDPRKNASLVPERAPRGPFETPKAKRTMTGSLHSSPLTINPKHQFDMKALAMDAMRDDATNASSLRNRETAEEAPRDDSGDAFLDIVQDRGGVNAHKVLRAVQRAAPSHSHAQYCFFSKEYRTPPSSTVPRGVSSGPWRLLTHGSLEAREQYLVSGLPQTILQKTGGLPVELFEWILDEICVQKSRLIQQEYCNLISNCPEHVQSRVTPERLEELFLRVGANEELKKNREELVVSKLEGEPYRDRDWSCVRSFIELLALMSEHLSLPSVKYALQTMLRMSIDKFLICTLDVLNDYENTVHCLLDALLQSSWDAFCAETGQFLHTTFKIQSIRINGLLTLPISSRRAHDLRRRLAITFLFDDPALGGQHPDTVITLRGIIDRLNGPDFAVTSKTDFEELRASILLLNIAVDDGSFVTTGDLEDEKKFNAEVDELATRLREIWRKINDAGMKLDRTKAKSVIEWVQQRMSHSVRTRRKMKKSVFDTATRRDDPFLSQQQSHMRNFLGKPVGNKKAGGNSPPVASGP